MLKVLVLHGPNLNLLGTRQPELYGTTSLPQIDLCLQELAEINHIKLTAYQSNSESELIAKIHEAKDQEINYIIINAAGLSHSSVILVDALLAVAIPFIEVHMSNIYARETFRHQSYLSRHAWGSIVGFASNSYKLALTSIIEKECYGH